MSTDAGGSETLPLGIDPGATAGVDSSFGESELPPAPPSGVFDARWIDDDISPSGFGEGLPVDIRQGSVSSNGTRQHEIRFQVEDAATAVTIEWDLLAEVSGTIVDKFDGSVYGPVEMTGNDSLTVSPGDPAALLTIDYNTAPTLDTNAGTTLDEGGQVAISTDSLSASDPDHDPSGLTFTVTNGPTEGTLLVGGTADTAFTQQDLIDGAVTYDHTANVAPGDVPPDDAFTFDLQDSKGEGPTGIVFPVSVLGTNDPPTAASDADTTQQGGSISISAPGVLENDSDPNGDLLSVSAVNGNASSVGQQVTLASGALLTVEATGAYSYDPNGAFDSLNDGDIGSDSFTYTASDGNGGSAQATVSLAIEGLNGAPVATDDSFATYEDSTLTIGAPGVLGNDNDPDADLLTPSVVSAPSNGTLTLSNDGSFEYVPASGFANTDSFTYEVADDSGATDQATVTLTVSGVRTVNLDDGWNLVSLPYQSGDQTFGTFLPSCTSGFLYDPSSGNQSLSDGDTLTVGEAFWANCPSGTEEVTGVKADSQTVSVAAGWNLVGPFGDSTDTGAISSDPQGIVESSLYGFDPSDGYTPVSTLVPGEGYWISVSASGTLTLGGGGGGTSLAASTRLHNAGGDGKTASLQVTDAEGREATLLLRRDRPASKQTGHMLPPIPPGGTFDVRFANGRALATVEPDASTPSLHDVNLQGVAYPLTLRRQGSPRAGGVLVRETRDSDADVRTLTSDAPSVTLQNGNGQLQVGLQSVPEQFALRNSAPNPARGAATIAFSVPEQTHVTIDVFDVLGRKVATLTDGQKEPGQHDVRLNARSLSSGTYFYRMSAEGFSKTRRLSVVR
ncbi:Ig-like domain-containing protein [Salinibacter grassmerensis]|uniref:Ig-like domain-containing protein n=1 Tax=Salinibacter grassmerensis TaxID=3040353 RepID=UPI0021E82AC0|nr:Ig-like domain-containing protein [Salinibacter grassmerensis]